MRIVIACITALLLVSCGSLKEVADQPMESQVKQWAVDKAFTIESDWAQPLRGSQINLIGNPNYLTVHKDTVSAELPFFGVRQTGNALQGGGIEFDGIPKNYQMIYNQKKNSSIIKFDITEKGESYRVTITLYDNQNSSITVNSSQRDLMRYEGRVEALPNEEN